VDIVNIATVRQNRLSDVNKDASRKVPFPRSNSIRIINAQYPNGVRKLNFPSETAEKAQNSTRRILLPNGIEMHQSASRISDQSEAAWASPDPYKRRRKIQFASCVPSDTEDTTSPYVQQTQHRTPREDARFEFPKFDINELSLPVMDPPSNPNPEKKDQVTLIPEMTPYICFLCGHQSMQRTNHRRHMLSHHGVREDGTPLVPPNAGAGPGEHQ